jgi:hypothetical protein
VQLLDACEMGLQWLPEAGGENGNTLVKPFAATNCDLVVTEIDVFDSKSHAFHEAQAAAVEKLGQEAIITAYVCDDRAGFVTGQDDRELGRAPNALDSGNEVELAVKHLLEQEEECAKSLVLGRRRDVAIDGKMGQEGGDFLFAHGVGMAFIVE